MTEKSPMEMLLVPFMIIIFLVVIAWVLGILPELMDSLG